MILFSFLVFLALFAVIGVASVLRKQNNRHDYFVAGGSVSPALVGLSAVATNNSGYMFIGVIGYTFSSGMAAVWLMIGWLAGDFVSSFMVHKRISQESKENGHVSFPALLANWGGKTNVNLQRVCAVISLLFLMAYAAAQLVAGSKALSVLLDWPASAGAVLGAALVLAYCYSGGIRASIWTDAAQSVVMIVAMLILLVVAVSNAGGADQVLSQLREIPGYMDLYPADLLFPGLSGLLMFIIGWAFGGLSVIGQPQIMIRFMTLEDSSKIKQVRAWYYSWFVAFYFMATGVGILARLYFQPDAFDPELALPMMAQDLLPAWLVGLTLAAIFAATISTADSLVLSCSSALSQDLAPGNVSSMKVIKGGTVLVVAVSLGLAMLNNQSVFSLVILAWSALGSAFAPLLIARCLNWNSSQSWAIAGVLVGLATVIVWRYFGLQSYVFEGMPGVILGLVFLYLGHLLIKYSDNKVSS